MTNILKACLPRSLKKRIRTSLALPGYLYRLAACYYYDFSRYYHSASKGADFVGIDKKRYAELRSWIAADTHKLEKGLSLKAPRPGFGKPVARRLLDNLQTYVDNFKTDRTIQIGINVLLTYCRFNEPHNEIEPPFFDAVKKIAEHMETCCESGALGGVLTLQRDTILQQGCLPGIEAFFSSRYSIRNFAPDPIHPEDVQKAVRMAQKTPSVCNRQSWKAYVFLEEADRKIIFGCQQGNRGFGEYAGGVLVCTSDLATFFSYGERNQAWIDGGMFCMSLVYALHAVGIGSCCLNWSADPEQDRHLRKLAGIPDHEAVIMVIAIGHLPETLNVAQSVRKPLSDVLIMGQCTKHE